MPSQRIIHVRAPRAGVQKRSAFQDRPPWAAFDSLNFWPVDYKEGVSRDRVATRPGFATFTSPPENPVGTVNSQGIVHIAPGQTYLRQPMCAADGILYRWDQGSGVWSAVASAAVDIDRPVCSFGYLQKYYVLNETLPYKVYTYSGHSVATWSAASLPTDCRFGCVWDDRIILTGDIANPHVVNFSRQGNPQDWVEAEDIGAPIASTSIEGGNIAEPVTAVVPHNRQCLLVGGWNTWLAYRGNPRRGGNLVRVSHTNGPVCWTSWCKTADDWLWYLSRDGLFKMPPGCGDTPISVSREYIPEELLALDGITNWAFLEYDVRFRMIHIYVTGDRIADYHYFPETGAFKPATIPGDDLQSICRAEQFETEDASGVLLGTDLGFQRLDRTASLEEGAEAFVEIGPIKLSESLDHGAVIREINSRFGANTTDIGGTLEIFCADDAEDATTKPLDRSYSETIEVLQDNNGRGYPNVGSHAAFIRIEQDDPAEHISFEQLDLHTVTHGKDR